MSFNSKITRLQSIIDIVPLTNGEKVLLATSILESCDPTPETSLGKLFDTCLEGMRFVAAACEEVGNKK